MGGRLDGVNMSPGRFFGGRCIKAPIISLLVPAWLAPWLSALKLMFHLAFTHKLFVHSANSL